MGIRLRRHRTPLIYAGFPVLVFAVLSGGYLGGLQWSGNHHVVIAHELYRSAQPSPTEIDDYRRSDGIKAILNLRGPHPGTRWYDLEIAESKRLGIVHVDFPMAQSRILSQAQARALLSVLRQSPKPLLIHCKAGSDRTGLASALYLAAIARTDWDTAVQQLSIRYGHIALPLPPEYAMDRSFEQLKPWLSAAGGYP